MVSNQVSKWGLPKGIHYNYNITIYGVGIATFNVRGRHKTTIISMQYEGFLTWFHWITGDKITNILIEKLPGGYLLQCFPLPTHHPPRLEPHLKKHWSVSDRVGVAEFTLPVTRDLRTSKLYVIVANRPHSKLSHDNPQIRDNFYDSLNRAWNNQRKERLWLSSLETLIPKWVANNRRKTTVSTYAHLRISNCRHDQLKVAHKQKWNQLQREIRRLVLNRANAILDAIKSSRGREA